MVGDISKLTIFYNAVSICTDMYQYIDILHRPGLETSPFSFYSVYDPCCHCYGYYYSLLIVIN